MKEPVLWTVYVCPDCKSTSWWSQINIKEKLVRVLCEGCQKILVELKVEVVR